MFRIKYVVSGLVKEQLYEDTFYAVSLRQAWYYFGKKYGFNIRDFKRLNSGGIAS
jgi:hypothetical protein